MFGLRCHPHFNALNDSFGSLEGGGISSSKLLMLQVEKWL
jgi:hypothetical protein